MFVPNDGYHETGGSEPTTDEQLRCGFLRRSSRVPNRLQPQEQSGANPGHLSTSQLEVCELGADQSELGLVALAG